MAEKRVSLKPTQSVGDTAVDGLLAGLAAGGVMALLLALLGLFSNLPPLAALGYFDPAQDGNWVTGLLAHMAISAMYGLVFALLVQGAQRIGRLSGSSPRAPLWMAGIVYGLVLFGLSRGVLATAVNSPLSQIAAWQWATVHAVYGLALSVWLGRKP